MLSEMSTKWACTSAASCVIAELPGTYSSGGSGRAPNLIYLSVAHKERTSWTSRTTAWLQQVLIHAVES